MRAQGSALLVERVFFAISPSVVTPTAGLINAVQRLIERRLSQHRSQIWAAPPAPQEHGFHRTSGLDSVGAEPDSFMQSISRNLLAFVRTVCP